MYIYNMKTFADINKYKNELLQEQQMMAQQETTRNQVQGAYRKDGVLPPAALQDMRTTTEKLADLNYVKKIIIGELSTVSNPVFASNVVDAVIKSPLNVDNSLLRFLANNVTEYVALLKKRYGVGIRGDVNDIANMVNFLNTLYVDTKKTTQSVSDYVKSSTNSNIQNTMSKENVSVILNELQNLVVLIRGLGLKYSTQLDDVINVFKKIYDYIPTQGQIDNLKNIINDPQLMVANDRNIQLTRITKFMELLKKLPKPSIITNIIETIKTNINTGNTSNIQDAINRINNYVRDFAENSSDFKNLDTILDTLTDEQRRDFVNKQEDIRRYENQMKNAQNVKVINWDEMANPPAQLNQPPDIMYGNGLKQAKRKGRPVGSGMCFKPFGECELNPEKLNEGIITIRKKKGKRSLIGVPSKKVSNNLKNIITTISGGGIPKHNDINGLDDEEKEYLSKLVKNSKIDRLDVPTPSKDNKEKLQHEFEVLKGQIMAGNDNKDLVREFKLLIRKLSKMKLLPANDVNDMIDLLITLGY